MLQFKLISIAVVCIPALFSSIFVTSIVIKGYLTSLSGNVVITNLELLPLVDVSGSVTLELIRLFKKYNTSPITVARVVIALTP
jgi:hypothetical protein